MYDPFTCGAAILRVFWLRLDSVGWKIFPQEDFRVRRFPYEGPHNIRTLPLNATGDRSAIDAHSFSMARTLEF